MTAIETFLLAKGIDITKALFVGFDGCNTMSGVNTGKEVKQIVVDNLYNYWKFMADIFFTY